MANRNILPSLLLCLTLTLCSCSAAQEQIAIEDDTVPLAALPDLPEESVEVPEEAESEAFLEAEAPGAESSTQQLADNVEITTNRTSSAEASDEDLLAAAEEVIAMYEANSFPAGEENRYAKLPEGCSLDDLDFVILQDAYMFPYAVTAQVGDKIEMIMGMEYVKESNATDARPEGWRVAAVLFR